MCDRKLALIRFMKVYNVANFFVELPDVFFQKKTKKLFELEAFFDIMRIFGSCEP